MHTANHSHAMQNLAGCYIQLYAWSSDPCGVALNVHHKNEKQRPLTLTLVHATSAMRATCARNDMRMRSFSVASELLNLSLMLTYSGWPVSHHY